MEYNTLNEKFNIVLGYDVVGKEYFVWDKTNNKWQWFKSLAQANNYFETQISYLQRLKRV